MNDPLVYVRAIHFAATLSVAGAVFFAVFIAGPALRKAPVGTPLGAGLWRKLAWIAAVALGLAVLSGAGWLLLTAAAMSELPIRQVVSAGVLATVLADTDFGRAWLLRFVLACLFAVLFVPVLSPRQAMPSWIRGATVILAAAFAGSLAWAGHGIGGQGVEGVLHPAADVLHLIAAAAWAGALCPLALLLAMTGPDAASLAVARQATLRFSTLGVVSVATLLATGIVNTWYLVGSLVALLGTEYGRLLLIKIALFLAMVAIAAVNRWRLTPRLVNDPIAAAVMQARRQLRCNAMIEAGLAAAVIAIVALLGTLPPASHAHHGHGAVPADAAYQHIHTAQGMADVTIEPGRVGTARATIRLWNDNDEPLAASGVTLTLTAPAAGTKPITRAATQDADGAWQVDGIALSEPGDWTVAIDATIGPNTRLKLEAPIEIDAQ